MNDRVKREILEKADKYVRNLFGLKSDWDMVEFKVNEKAAEIKYESGDEITLKVKMDIDLLYPHSERTPDGQGALWPDTPSDLYVGNKDGVLLTAADHGQVKDCTTCANDGGEGDCAVIGCDKEAGYTLWEPIPVPVQSGEPCPGCDYFCDKLDDGTDEPVRDADGQIIKECTRLFGDLEPCGPANGYRDFAGEVDEGADTVDGGEHEAAQEGQATDNSAVLVDGQGGEQPATSAQ